MEEGDVDFLLKAGTIRERFDPDGDAVFRFRSDGNHSVRNRSEKIRADAAAKETDQVTDSEASPKSEPVLDLRPPSKPILIRKVRKFRWDGETVELVSVPIRKSELFVQLDQFIPSLYHFVASSPSSDLNLPTSEKIQSHSSRKPETELSGLVSTSAVPIVEQENEYGEIRRAS